MQAEINRARATLTALTEAQASLERRRKEHLATSAVSQAVLARAEEDRLAAVAALEVVRSNVTEAARRQAFAADAYEDASQTLATMSASATGAARIVADIRRRYEEQSKRIRDILVRRICLETTWATW